MGCLGGVGGRDVYICRSEPWVVLVSSRRRIKSADDEMYKSNIKSHLHA